MELSYVWYLLTMLVQLHKILHNSRYWPQSKMLYGIARNGLFQIELQSEKLWGTLQKEKYHFNLLMNIVPVLLAWE